MKSDSAAERRLRLLTDIKVNIYEARDNLAEESHQRVGLEKMETIQLAIKRERTLGRHGGSYNWPVHIVLFIFELLVNGTPPSAVYANIQTMSATIIGREVN